MRKPWTGRDKSGFRLIKEGEYREGIIWSNKDRRDRRQRQKQFS